MSKIAENKALELFPLRSIDGGEIEAYFNAGQLHKREIYIECYDQAFKDFLEKACKFLDDRIGIDQKIEVNENGEPLADSYIAYCVARKQEAERVINIFKNYMQNEEK